MDDVSGGGRGLRRRWLRRTGLLGIVAGTGVLTVACGGGSGAPQVASLAHGSGSGAASPASNGGGNSAASASDGNVTQLLDQWAACMRSHGDSGQADPTVDASKVIHVTMASSVPGGIFGTNGQDPSGGPGVHCATYLNDASNALAGPGSSSGKTPDQATLDKFSACVRADGIPDFPDLNESNGGSHFQSNGGDLSPDNPALQNAMKLCAEKVGVPGMGGQSTTPGSIVQDFAGGGPGANG
jgi:hypothetical protein